MKVSREQAAANRERILDIASIRFRERGFDGIGIADLMQEAGLTHGGFYGHFASKEDLLAEVCERTLADSIARWAGICARGDGNPVSTIARNYLSTRHRDDPAHGCAVPALGIESARRAPQARRAITRGVRGLLDVLAGAMPGTTRAARRRHALTSFAGLVGAIVLARAVDDAKLSEEILAAVAASIEQAAA
jgi:TetR/AcrR family transcriptional repressor of nem operon